MAKKVFFISALILGLASVDASAQTVLNAGGQTCEKWTEVHEYPSPTTETSRFDGWVIGYVQGKAATIEAENRIKGFPAIKVLRGMDDPTVVQLTGVYCRGNPVRTLAEVGDTLMAQAVADSSSNVVVVGPSRVKIVTQKPLAETTGSGDITGSINPTHRCELITVSDASETIIRRFRKCD
jgi:hypothetical protein